MLEHVIVHQQRNWPNGSDWQFSGTDEQPEGEEPDAFDKFYADAVLRGYGLDPDKIRKEAAAIEQRAAEIISKTHGASEGATTPARSALAKDAKVARTIRTEYPSGRCVVAELNESGAVIRTFTEGQ